jgi:hypothetical protein
MRISSSTTKDEYSITTATITHTIKSIEYRVEYWPESYTYSSDIKGPIMHIRYRPIQSPVLKTIYTAYYPPIHITPVNVHLKLPMYLTFL